MCYVSKKVNATIAIQFVINELIIVFFFSAMVIIIRHFAARVSW